MIHLFAVRQAKTFLCIEVFRLYLQHLNDLNGALQVLVLRGALIRALPAGEKCLHEQIAHLDARQCGIHNHFCFLLSWFYPRWTVYGIRLCKSTVYL